MNIDIKNLNRRQRTTAGAVTGGVALVVLLGLGVASCSPNATADQTPTATPTASATATLTQREKAIADAEQAIRSFSQVDDEISGDPTAPLSGYDTVATSIALVKVKAYTEAQRKKGLHQSGSFKIVSITPTSLIDLSYEPGKQPPVVPLIEFKTCSDVSGAQVVDAKGVVKTKKDRMLRVEETFRVYNYSGPDDPNGWKVGSIDDLVKPC